MYLSRDEAIKELSRCVYLHGFTYSELIEKSNGELEKILNCVMESDGNGEEFKVE